ncbi:uncharacterized protein LOC133780042 [Humulus lupulus]|uniref:uncharacterized protein LOC133780042 n=1 Tax=Humulus lupulus TaxID=3486 RepID=UPI002B410668|nr:uncharacterized protein LOC133780042 [Humulus lupulus]
MMMGLTMVKFNDEATRDHVLENVPLWIQLHDLGLQYWGSKCLSALVSTIGKPLMVEKFTRERSRIQFARALVEMEITDNPPRNIQFLNEHGQIVEQGVEYEWLPIKCKVCSWFGHSMVDCRKELKNQWVKKDDVAKTEAIERRNKDSDEHNDEIPKVLPSANAAEGVPVQNPKGLQLPVAAKVDQLKETNEGEQWQTPKRVATQSRQGPTTSISVSPPGQVQKQLNKFVVLQEQMKGGKEGNIGSNSSNG